MDILDFIAKTKSDIESALRQRILGRSDREILWRMIANGKKLRSLLCVLSYRACGGEDADYWKALDVAAAVELGHCASLCHDDIVDRDFARRGHSALWVSNGVPETLIAGHRAISLGLQISLSHGEEIAETFMEAWDRALKGGLMELEARRAGTISADDYLEIIKEKTASLFSAASKVGSQIARAPRHLQGLMADYGMAVGVAYQLADDMSELHEKKDGELSFMIELPNKGDEGVSLPEFLMGEMENEIKRAEESSQDYRLPSGEFKFILNKMPRYFTGQILNELGEYKPSLHPIVTHLDLTM